MGCGSAWLSRRDRPLCTRREEYRLPPRVRGQGFFAAASVPQNREGMARFGIRVEKASGVSIPKLRSLAREIGRNHVLAQQLWASGIHEARILATMIDDWRLAEAVEALLLPTLHHIEEAPSYGLLAVKEAGKGETGELAVARVARALYSKLETGEPEAYTAFISADSSRTLGEVLVAAEQVQHLLNAPSSTLYHRGKGASSPASLLALISARPPISGTPWEPSLKASKLTTSRT